MDKTAVIGVVAPCFSGAVKSCTECVESHKDSTACNGFGPGCLLAPSPKGSANTQPGNPEDDFVHLHKP